MVRHDYICETWLIYGETWLIYVRHDLYVWDMTHTCETWLIRMRRLPVSSSRCESHVTYERDMSHIDESCHIGLETSLNTIWWARGNANLLVQINQKNNRKLRSCRMGIDSLTRMSHVSLTRLTRMSHVSLTRMSHVSLTRLTRMSHVSPHVWVMSVSHVSHVWVMSFSHVWVIDMDSLTHMS